MKTYFRLLSFAKPIEKFAIPYIITTLFAIVFNTFLFTLLGPVSYTHLDVYKRQLERAAPLMRELRPIKSPIEIDLTQQACDITKDAFLRVLKFVKPGVTEYEIEAEIIHEFIRKRATGHGYSPIIASGNNANILHYTDNNQTCKDGELVLMDFGAEYANYNACLLYTSL